MPASLPGLPGPAFLPAQIGGELGSDRGKTFVKVAVDGVDLWVLRTLAHSAAAPALADATGTAGATALISTAADAPGTASPRALKLAASAAAAGVGGGHVVLGNTSEAGRWRAATAGYLQKHLLRRRVSVWWEGPQQFYEGRIVGEDIPESCAVFHCLPATPLAEARLPRALLQVASLRLCRLPEHVTPAPKPCLHHAGCCSACPCPGRLALKLSCPACAAPLFGPACAAFYGERLGHGGALRCASHNWPMLAHCLFNTPLTHPAHPPPSGRDPVGGAAAPTGPPPAAQSPV